MTWLVIYGSVAVAVLAVSTVCCARNLHGDPLRLVAIAAAAALWPVMAIGLLQYAAIHALAVHLRRRSALSDHAPVTADPVTAPLNLFDSFARFAPRIGATRHA